MREKEGAASFGAAFSYMPCTRYIDAAFGGAARRRLQILRKSMAGSVTLGAIFASSIRGENEGKEPEDRD